MLELREKEILSTLEKIKNFDFVLICGYAVNVYTQPRFSVDCDIVVQNKEEAKKIRIVLEKEGYREKEINPNIPYHGEFLCLVKKINDYSVPFGILIGNVIDRDTGLKFPAEWIFENSKKQTLVGKANLIKIDLKVANPEILIIMKLAASRISDFRDIFMLLDENINLEYVFSELKTYRLYDKLRKFREYVTSKSFKDSLQGVFGKIDEKVFNKIIQKIKNIKTKT